MANDFYSRSLELHKEKRGKLEIRPRVPLKTRDDMSLAYTPGVAAVSRKIAEDRKFAYDYTIKGNSVAVVTDGTAVLGLGNVGPLAAIPVMEGKAILMKELAGIDAFPIAYEGEPKDLVDFVRSLAPVFGAINLEDIAAPRCFEVEEELQDLGIPVMHDDQHGTAVTVLAALVNACRVTGKNLEDLVVVISGAGAAGFAIAGLLHCLGISRRICTSVKELYVCDSKGIIYRGRKDLIRNRTKYIISQETNHEKRQGGLSEALKGADVFIGVSAPGIVTTEMVESMNRDPIVFALSNPEPEIMPDLAKKAGASVVGTGRSDFPNQINNVLAFPGIFRGALDSRAKRITDEMKLAAAHAIADYVKSPTRERILPDAFDKGVAQSVAKAVKRVAKENGIEDQ